MNKTTSEDWMKSYELSEQIIRDVLDADVTVGGALTAICMASAEIIKTFGAATETSYEDVKDTFIAAVNKACEELG